MILRELQCPGDGLADESARSRYGVGDILGAQAPQRRLLNFEQRFDALCVCLREIFARNALALLDDQDLVLQSRDLIEPLLCDGEQARRVADDLIEPGAERFASARLDSDRRELPAHARGSPPVP